MKKRIETVYRYALKWRKATRLTPVVIENMKVVYYPIPKIASSSVKSYFLEHAIKISNKNKQSLGRIHYSHYPTMPVSKARRLAGYTSFVVVRNPAHRIWSCYQDKIVRYKETGEPLRSAFDRYNIIFGKNFFDVDMSFEKFVSSVAKIPDWASDQHFRSQYKYVYVHKNKVSVDRIIRLENLDLDMRKLTNQLGLPQWDSRLLNESKARNNFPDISPEIAEKIYKRYRLDYELCGYAHEFK